MNKSNIIEHSGIVTSVTGNMATVRFLTSSACAGCQASGVCDAGGTNEKVVTARCDEEIHTGDHVSIIMKESLGFRALFLGYLLPFLLVLTLLIVLSLLSFSEVIAGVASLLLLPPYYYLLYLKKEKISNKFSFIIKK
jgi:sigma-E factor negative regulatory protein RseC